MKYLAIALAALILLGYAALAHASPHFGLFHPRGGAATLGISLLAAIGAIWVASQPGREPAMRLQLAAAGWIWLLVQAGAIAYLRAHAVGT